MPLIWVSFCGGSTLGHEAYLVGGTANGEVNIGDRRINGLSAGADDTDAVNVAQLNETNAKVTRHEAEEHPFGTLKACMAATHFLTRMLDRVSTEMSLHVLACNFKRVPDLLGSNAPMAGMKA